MEYVLRTMVQKEVDKALERKGTRSIGNVEPSSSSMPAVSNGNDEPSSSRMPAVNNGNEVRKEGRKDGRS